MRMLRYRIIRLEKETVRHKPIPTGVLTEIDNTFYDKLIDIPSIERQQQQQQYQKELELLQHHIYFIQQHTAYPNPLNIGKIRSLSTQKELGIFSVSLPDETEPIQPKQQKQQLSCGEIKDKTIKQEFIKLCKEYKDNVLREYTDIGKIESVTLKLDLKPGTEPPTKKAPRRHNKITQEQWAKHRPLLADQDL